jgi:hypothetical protein
MSNKFDSWWRVSSPKCSRAAGMDLSSAGIDLSNLVTKGQQRPTPRGEKKSDSPSPHLRIENISRTVLNKIRNVKKFTWLII